MPASYDIALGWAGDVEAGVAYGSWGHYLVGLTTRRFTLVANAQDKGSTYVTGVGVDYPAPTVVDQKYVVFVSDGVDTRGFGNSVGTPTPTELRFGLGATSPSTRDISMLAYTNGSGALDAPPTHFVGYARTSFSLVGTTNRAPTPVETRWAPTLAPIGEVTVTATATPAEGQTIYEAISVVRVEPSTQWDFLTNAPRRQMPWSLVLPKVPGLELGMLIQAFDTGKPGSAGGASSRALVPLMPDDSVPPVTLMPSPIISPPAGALRPGATIAWTGGGGICSVELLVLASGPNQQRSLQVVVRDSTSITVPDLSDVGYTFPRLATFGATVACSKRLDGTTTEAAMFDRDAGMYRYRGLAREPGYQARSIPVQIVTE